MGAIWFWLAKGIAELIPWVVLWIVIVLWGLWINRKR